MIRRMICLNSVLLALLAAVLFIYPPVRAILDLQDPALRQPGVPKAAWRLCRNLSPRYAAWAQKRVVGQRAEGLDPGDISGTEWPLFGSVFYLWAVENLQAAWEAGDHSAGVEPRVYCQEAIRAAAELVVDPKHATWVKRHWGDDYLHRENVFYRMLVMAALTSREKLLHDGAHLDLLRDQVESFTRELDASPHGLLNDYPGECYPADVIAAIACVQRAATVLGTNYSPFVSRALRGFIGTQATPHQLPPYLANPATGRPLSEARGCANSYLCQLAPELWPEQAQRWYALQDKFFWQHRIAADGFREFAADMPRRNWSVDVDAGPVIAGHGVSASAFGLGATRRNGRFDRAYPLAAEMLAMVWELPHGVLALPRLLSNLSDAPLLGEAAILWQLSVQPAKGFPVKTGGQIPACVYIVLLAALLLGTWRLLDSLFTFKMARREPEPEIRAPRLQIPLWFLLLAGAIAAGWMGPWWLGLLLLLGALALPLKSQRTARDDLKELAPSPMPGESKDGEGPRNSSAGQER